MSTNAMSGLLYISGDADHQARVFRDERRGYWAAGLPAVLEKHGLLALTEGGLDDLVASGAESWDAVLIAGLGEDAWTDDVVAAVTAATRPLFIDGPPPARLRAALGVRTVEPIQDPRLTISVADLDLSTLARAYGALPGARLHASQSRPVPRDADKDWTSIPAVPLTLERAFAWRTPGWDAAICAVDSDVEVLATLTPEGGTPTPAICRRGHLYWSAFGMLAALGQAHTAEPWDSGEFRNSPRATGLELTLLGIIDLMHAARGAVRHRVLPWPCGGEWVLNVRHDFDRFLAPKHVQHLLARHESVGTAATWYWRWRHLVAAPERRHRLRGRHRKGVAAIRAVATDPRHEVALHTEQLWTGAERERQIVERAIKRPVVGTSSHGDPTCFRFQGAPNILWAEAQGMRYTELIQHAHYHPHRFASMGPDGHITLLDVVCLPHHESFDLTMKPGGTATDRIKERAPAFASAGGMLQVMNHPDIHTDELFATLAELPTEGRLDWTAARTADWWRRTHALDRLRIEPAADGTCRVRAEEDVEDLVVESLAPDGTRRRAIVRVDAGGSSPAHPALEVSA